MRTQALRGAVYHETKRGKHTWKMMRPPLIRLTSFLDSCLYISGLEPVAWPLGSCLRPLTVKKMTVMMGRWQDEKISGGECPGLSWPGYLCHSYVIIISRPPRQCREDSRPRSILQYRVSFTNSHLSPLGLPKSPTNVEGRAKCAQSCQVWPRSDGQIERAGSTAHVASWMPKCCGL